MRFILLFITFILAHQGITQQSANDVTQWKTSVEQKPNSNTATLIITANLEGDWHGYSIHPAAPDDGPLPTEFTFTENSNYSLKGKMTESEMKKGFDEIFELDVMEFHPSATFKQEIEIQSDKDFIIQANVFYQVCREGMCIMGDKNLEFFIDGAPATTKTSIENSKTSQTEEIEQTTSSDNLNYPTIDWTYTLTEVEKNGKFNLLLEPTLGDNEKLIAPNDLQSFFSIPEEEGMTFSPFMLAKGAKKEGGIYRSPKFRTSIDYDGDDSPAIALIINYSIEKEDSIYAFSDKIIINFANAQLLTSGECEPKYFDGDEDGFSYWQLMIEAFLFGLASLLTPCVFPMIPMTVTFFIKGAEKNSRATGIKNASLYGLSIIGIYTLIGTIVAATLGQDFANWLATHWIPNVLFFLIFIIFAASFLGMFELRLPNWMIEKSDKQADKGGVIGIFFMALTLVLVSFSCTGPIVGMILIQASRGAVIEPMLGMFAFSLAFALPFTLFAIFPSWLSKLPQSGGWLNTVKVVLGFLEIALGLKFLSVADQTYHWGLLDREVYIALWIVIFLLLAFYLLGKLKFAHDSDLPYLKVPRLFMAIGVLAFVVYLTPGLIGHPLKALSGYLPPMSTHDFDLLGEIRGVDENQCGETPSYSDFLHLPHGISGYFDFEEALSCARAQNKPLFIDFTGHGCVNCREMEAKVWSDPEILKLLKEKFVVVALYVDDKKVLPEDKWISSKIDGKVKKSIGEINLDFQVCNFDKNAQPLYVTLDKNEDLLASPVGYVSKDQFKNFLEQSLVAHKKQQKGVSPI